MDESLLPPEAGEQRPFPWRGVAAAIVPFAALAAGSGLSRALDPPQADTVLRWLFWSGAAGLLLGSTCGLLLGRAWRWLLYGPLSAFAVVALVAGAVRASLPAREWLADRAEAHCRREGRAICSVHQFDLACASGDRATLGPPAQTLCIDHGCTYRWTYAGPFRPGTVQARTLLLCSLTVDGQGAPQRSTVMAIAIP